MREKLTGIVAVLALDVLVFCSWYWERLWSTFGDKFPAYREYLDLCFIFTMSFWLGGQVISWLYLRKNNYRWKAIISAFVGHSILGLVPLVMITAGNILRGIGEGYVFESGPWHALIEVFFQLQWIWLRVMTEIMGLWYLWIFFVVLSFGVIKLNFGRNMKDKPDA